MTRLDAGVPGVIPPCPGLCRSSDQMIRMVPSGLNVRLLIFSLQRQCIAEMYRTAPEAANWRARHEPQALWVPTLAQELDAEGQGQRGQGLTDPEEIPASAYKSK